MLQSIHIKLMLSLGCCFYGPMWTLGAALHSWGDVSQKAKSHGAQPEDGGKQLIECILEAYISLYSVSIQPLVNNYEAIALHHFKIKKETTQGWKADDFPPNIAWLQMSAHKCLLEFILSNGMEERFQGTVVKANVLYLRLGSYKSVIVSTEN